MNILIKNGKLYDGSGLPPQMRDVLIQGERIARIGENLESEAGFVIDAEGKVVTPGFIDIHRHCDIKPFYKSDYETCILAQGITTIVVGNCGISMTPCSHDPKVAKAKRNFDSAVLGTAYSGIETYHDYMEQLEQKTLPFNIAAMIGTGSVKITVKGFSDTPYTEEEMQRAIELLDDAMEEGAPGISAGIMYQPECYSTTEEFVRLLKCVGKYGRTVAFHIRGEGDHMVDSVKEVVEIGKRAGCSVEISHFKSCGIKNWKKEIHRAIEVIDEARSQGQDVTVDFYPYTGGSTALTTMLPPEFVAGDMEKALEHLGTDCGVKEFRKLASIEYDDWDNYCLTLGWDRILISGVEKSENRKFLGLSVEEASKKFGYEDAYALAAYLMHEEHGKTTIINISMCQEDVDTVAKLPYSLVISDAIYGETDTPHPRMYGAFPKIIREYVKERCVLTLEEAVRKMTAMPAERMRLKERGRLQEGFFADLNIFDPDEFRDHATIQKSARLATGLDYCMVNGRIVYQKGVDTGEKPGKVIRIS